MKSIFFFSFRIVFVCSSLCKDGVVDLDNLNYESGIRSTRSRTSVGYADSKLMLALFALKLKMELMVIRLWSRGF